MGAWGYDLFNSDHDFDLISDLGGEAGLHTLEGEAAAQAKAAGEPEDVYTNISYSIYAPCCSDTDFVRNYLDSGVLETLTKAKKAKLLKPGSTFDFNDPCYAYVLLGACAMTLGCRLPGSYVTMLKKVYTEGGLLRGALRQMKKALFGPNGFENGVPYDFESKDLIDTANSQDDDDRQTSFGGVQLMNVIGPGGFFNTGMGDSRSSTVIKELRDMHDNPNKCGGCRAKEGKGGGELLRCGKCKHRNYCSVECQKACWSVHKKVCDPAEK
ncbi:hypothetical protein K504DRAFT_498355 [Pleomassaria siparia CBS 279.74]|uniref:MYND-type domain-containing protein n=1 Tax=Pleomassaria siparia CBS 279.74 TaxID=1314801 RepID=A0A6G1KL38_9PLEO|nr:hypothetical protein K504DRAFT_498355 [Pleomassaria siparia CBS 279.74]